MATSAQRASQTSTVSIRDENGPNLRIDVAVVSQIRAQIRGAGPWRTKHEGAGGILLGAYDSANTTLTIVSCKPCGQNAAFLAAEALRHPLCLERPDADDSRPLAAVGFYRIFKDDIAFPKEDLRLIQEHFSEQPNLFLLAAHSRRSVSLFSWTGNGLRRRRGEIDIDFPSDTSHSEPPEAREMVGNRPATGTFRNEARRIAAIAIGRRWIVGAAIVVVASGIALLSRPVRPESTLQRSSGIAGSSSQDAGLNLTAERVGNDWRITWDRANPILLKARAAVLLINDGASRQELLLDAAQVSSGNVVYSPEQDRVQFRLALITADGGSITASLTAIGSKRGVLPSSPPMLSPESLMDAGDKLFNARSANPSRRIRGSVGSDESTGTGVSLPSKPFVPPQFGSTLRPQTDTVRLPDLPVGVTMLPGAMPPLMAPTLGVQPAPPPPPVTSATASTQAGPLTRGPETSVNDQSPYVPARVLQRTAFVVPAYLRTLAPPGIRFSLTAELDADGRIVRTKSNSETGVSGHLRRIADQCVRDWKFAPAQLGDKPVPSEVVLNFTIPPVQQ